MKTSEELCEWAWSRADALQTGMRFTPGTRQGYWELDDNRTTGPLSALVASAFDFLRTYSGEDSEWLARAKNAFANSGNNQSWPSGVHAVSDVLRQWVDDVRAGVAVVHLGAVEGARVIATTDVMDQVRALLTDKTVHPAAPIVLAGAALETALRGAVEEAGVEVVGKGSITAYAKALRASELITKQEMKDVEQMSGTRNLAAHGDFEELSRERAGLMEQQVNLFLSRLSERFGD